MQLEVLVLHKQRGLPSYLSADYVGAAWVAEAGTHTLRCGWVALPLGLNGCAPTVCHYTKPRALVGLIKVIVSCACC